MRRSLCLSATLDGTRALPARLGARILAQMPLIFAVIVQPDGRVPMFVTTRDVAEGPCWPQEDHLPVDDDAQDGTEDEDEGPWQFLGGAPRWLQGDETPGPGWRLLGQLDDSLGYNFGDAGIAYIFVSPDGDEGRFLWQCG